MSDPVTKDDRYSIVCPPCFAELAEESGVAPAGRTIWHFAIEGMSAAQLRQLWAVPGQRWEHLTNIPCGLWAEPSPEDETAVKELREPVAERTEP